MNILAGALKTTLIETGPAVTTIRGDEFEQYVKSRLFPRESYDILYKSPEFGDNRGNSIASPKQPDCKYVSKNEGYEFFVEPKFRARFQNQILEWGKFFDLNRCQEMDMVLPVLIAIGLGGRPSAPEKVFLVPARYAKFVKQYPSLMQKYEVEPGCSVSEEFLKRILE